MQSNLLARRAVYITGRRFKSKLTVPKFIPLEYQFDYENYPKLKPELYQLRDPYKKYDDQQLRRNFNEPVHPNYDLLDVWSPDWYQFVDDLYAAKMLFGAFLSIGIFAGFIYYFDLYPDRPNFPRSYPYDGLLKDLGAKDETDSHLYRARVDKTV